MLDYGVGNLGSVVNMFKRVGAQTELVSDPDILAGANKALLAAVGSFDNGMQQLAASGLVEPLKRLVLGGAVPVLGICLGMQMLGDGSEEGIVPGLGFIKAHCHRFRFPDNPEMKVPHMGWNLIKPCKASPLLAGLDTEPRFYFVHSYHMVCDDAGDVLTTTQYGNEFVSMVQHGNIIGAQFHPEKSHRFGMILLKNFAEL